MLAMGKDAAIKGDRRHTKKLFGGRETAQEVHWKIAWNGARCLCGGAAAIRIRVFTPATELKPGGKFDLLAMRLAMGNDGKIPCADFKGPGGISVRYVRLTDVFACTACQKEAEKAAAHPPSDWPEVFIEIDRGPGPDKPLVAVQ